MQRVVDFAIEKTEIEGKSEDHEKTEYDFFQVHANDSFLILYFLTVIYESSPG
jgi:hypothetical protein